MIRHTLRFELLALARNPRARFFTLAFPVLLLAIARPRLRGHSRRANGPSSTCAPADGTARYDGASRCASLHASRAAATSALARAPIAGLRFLLTLWLARPCR